MDNTKKVHAKIFTHGLKKRAPVVCTLLALLTLPQADALIAAEAETSPGIDRQGESRILYSTIKIPANAETLYMSGVGASPLADGSWGNMEQQAMDIFNKFKATLEEQGWTMADVIQVRVFAVAGADGALDFDGFNKGYLAFFGTTENPVKPVRTFVQVADLVRDGWLVEVEVRAARVPQ
jgi:enamine deaminase RidA (YjgF/YER057c/UK114 family)